jgi:hypothetical protein
VPVSFVRQRVMKRLKARRKTAAGFDFPDLTDFLLNFNLISYLFQFGFLSFFFATRNEQRLPGCSESAFGIFNMWISADLFFLSSH